MVQTDARSIQTKNLRVFEHLHENADLAFGHNAKQLIEE